MNALLHLTSYLLPRLSYQLETKFETFKEITRDQDQDFGLLVSRPRPRPLKNELECTRVTRPWSRDHNTASLPLITASEDSQLCYEAWIASFSDLSVSYTGNWLTPSRRDPGIRNSSIPNPGNRKQDAKLG